MTAVCTILEDKGLEGIKRRPRNAGCSVHCLGLHCRGIAGPVQGVNNEIVFRGME